MSYMKERLIDELETCQYCGSEVRDMHTMRGRTMCQDCYDVACDMEYEAMKDARMLDKEMN